MLKLNILLNKEEIRVQGCKNKMKLFLSETDSCYVCSFSGVCKYMQMPNLTGKHRHILKI